MQKDMVRELQSEIAKNSTLLQKLFDKWKIDFNRFRLHETLNMMTPEPVYLKSERLFDPNADLTISYPYGFK